MGRIIAPAAIGAAVLALTACGGSGHWHITGGGSQSGGSSPSAGAEPGVSTYLCSGSTEDDLLQWRDSGGYLSGTYQYAKLSGQPPQEQVSSSSANLSGTLNGTAITLNIGLSQDLYGTVSGGQLTLNVPQQNGTIQAGTCNQATVDDWNSAVGSLNYQAGSDNQAANQQAAQQQHDQNVSQAQQSLSSDVSSLENDSSSLNKDNSQAWREVRR